VLFVRSQTSTLSESTVTSFASAPPTAARYNWRGCLIEAATPALGYDEAGVLRGYTAQEISGGTVRCTDTYSYEYSLQDGYLETKVTGTSSHQNRHASETLSSYDGWGRRTSLEERTNLEDFNQTLRSARYFAYDAEGGLISRREGELVEEQGKALQFRQARKEDDKFKNAKPVPHLIEQAKCETTHNDALCRFDAVRPLSVFVHSNAGQRTGLGLIACESVIDGPLCPNLVHC
jgi:hypothetical protein